MAQNIITGQEESIPHEAGVGVLPRQGKLTVVASYDFSRQGGAIGTIRLPSDIIPSGAVITNAYLDVKTVPTSGGAATIAVQVESAGDILAAAAISGAPWSSTGAKDTIPEPGTETSYIKTTAARQIAIVIAVAALLTGRFSVIIEYDIAGA